MGKSAVVFDPVPLFIRRRCSLNPLRSPLRAVCNFFSIIMDLWFQTYSMCFKPLWLSFLLMYTLLLLSLVRTSLSWFFSSLVSFQESFSARFFMRQGVPNSSYTFSTPGQEMLVLFNERLHLETKNKIQRRFIASKLVIVLRPFQNLYHV